MRGQPTTPWTRPVQCGHDQRRVGRPRLGASPVVPPTERAPSARRVERSGTADRAQLR